MFTNIDREGRVEKVIIEAEEKEKIWPEMGSREFRSNYQDELSVGI